MAKYALHIGLDNTSYRIDEGVINTNSCVASSKYFNELSLSCGFIQGDPLHQKEATSYNIFKYFGKLSKTIKAGDLLFITYCGHGTSIRARSEEDGSSEVLILYDRIFLDQELRNCLTWLDKDVFIFIVTNSCRNGTLFNKKIKLKLPPSFKPDKLITDPNFPEPDEFISGQQYANYLNAIKFYLNDYTRLRNPIIHIASSSDYQNSKDSEVKGEKSEFAIAFEKVISDKSPCSYIDFFNELDKLLPNPKPFLETNLKTKKQKAFLKSILMS